MLEHFEGSLQDLKGRWTLMSFGNGLSHHRDHRERLARLERLVRLELPKAWV